MKTFYLLALVVIFVGCGELEKQKTLTVSDIRDSSNNNDFVPVFGAENDPKINTAFNVLLSSNLSGGGVKSIKRPR